MYAQKLSVYDFRCFGRAVLDLQYPGRKVAKGKDKLELPNVNLILGDNGGGKSSILRAIAIASLAPILMESGFVANRMIRRPDAEKSLLKVDAVLDQVEIGSGKKGKDSKPEELDLLARFERRPNAGNRDALTLDSTPKTPLAQLIYDDFSPAFFVVGYGATRRVETGEFSDSSARKSRGLRYYRVASLFEDQVSMRPMDQWFRRLSGKGQKEAIKLLNSVLPENVRFGGKFDSLEGQYQFEFDGHSTPFSSLSDGYKAFIGMAGDLIGHLGEVSADQMAIENIPGIVLIDEIDLHLHPAWQRTILPSLAKAFPRLQFVCTTHSPLVASAVQPENVFVTSLDDDGRATISQMQESTYARSSEQLLLSPYFGLETTRPVSFEAEAEDLFEKAAKGDKEAALTYLEELTAPTKARS